MVDEFTNFADLSQHYQDEIHYKIQFPPDNRGGKILILTPHGGGIEPGTSELVRAIAGDDLSYYIFEGLLQSGNKVLHITSHCFDEPSGIELVSKFESALAIHGCDADQPIIYIGGKDAALKNKLFDALKKEKYLVFLQAKGREYAGQDIKNICNRTISGGGVQLEFSKKIRELMFLNLSRSGRQTTLPFFDKLVRNIREVIL